jgi:Ca2+-binding EF-hand superfamily protein
MQALDRDRDGKLSRSELNAAVTRLRSFDIDEDECLTPFELAPALLTEPAPANKRPRYAVVIRRASQKSDDWLAEVFDHYDRDGDGFLTRSEIDLGSDFARLDRDGDGKPSPSELASWFKRQPHHELSLRVGGPRILLSQGALHCDLAAVPGPSRVSLEGKAHEAARRVATLWVVPQARGWFEWLDQDQDGQLSVHELKGAWERLGDDEARRRGWLQPPDSDLTHFTFTLVRGPSRGYGVQLTRTGQHRSAGPAWYRSMDRNGDGFVSRSEFIGTKEQFDRLDLNRDGLIDPVEAETAGAPTRRKEKP